ncbi:hypothetical protein KDL01_24180 [Actinospica durhamensis]|uniref:Uncharacterized protein n=1 Tax=Actinospica durhamensis TaxID=1508375 RepID=A0A941ITT8_9ACTN|nr:hypothetical protein [Actinospica durhamensis]MBR7836398.1 hypothetical protein [Actinospica durhamensis]
MTNAYLRTGSVWRLLHGEQEVARLTVVGSDMPWVYARVDDFPGFEEFRALFVAQERAIDDGDDVRADDLYAQIRAALTLSFPDGRPVPEFLLHVRLDGSAAWRWHGEAFAAVG